MTKCAGCRVRHLSCDAHNSCRECEKGGRECVRLNVRFRNLVCPAEKVAGADCKEYEFFFDKEQTWVQVDGSLVFVTEGEGGVGDSLSGGLEEDGVANGGMMAGLGSGVEEGQSSAGMDESSLNSATMRIPLLDGEPPDCSVALEQLPHDTRNESPIDDEEANTLGQTSREHLQTTDTVFTGTKISISSKLQQVTKPVRPLDSLEEAKLLQHFITHLAPWFDVGDSGRHFGKLATCMAAKSPLLMTAILAIASLHYSRTSGQSDIYYAMTLHDRCLSMIVPMLGDSNGANEDCILMTTTILHLYDGLESGVDLPRHLKGTSSFFPVGSTYNSSPLRTAVFWLHLRQEIYNAYWYQRSVETDLSDCTLDFDHRSCDNDMWFHQTLYYGAQVTKWAFGQNAAPARWYELDDQLSRWERTRPASFNPIHFRTRDPPSGRFFPEVCYITDEHVAAAHFFYMAKLLLVTHDPNLPRIGTRVKSAQLAMQETALSYVRTLVGIAVCNTWVPARFTANLAIVICGGWFTELKEQEALMGFMRDTSRYSGWEKQDAERTLMEAWGWEEGG